MVNGYWPEDDRPPPVTKTVRPPRSGFWAVWVVEDVLPLCCIVFALFIIVIGLWTLDLWLAGLFTGLLLVGCVWLAWGHALRRVRP